MRRPRQPEGSSAVRVAIDQLEFGRRDGSAWDRGNWPARWICHPALPGGPVVLAFRLLVHLDRDVRARVHVAADERYSLHLDGMDVGRGNERGSPWRWSFDSYELQLAAGRHSLVARVWRLGSAAPAAQMSVAPGFLLLAEGDSERLMTTGLAAWECAILPGYSFVGGPLTFGSGHDEVVDDSVVPKDWRCGQGCDWGPVAVGQPGTDFRSNADRIGLVHRLSPATLPSLERGPLTTCTIRYLDHVHPDETRSSPVHAAHHRAAEAHAWRMWLEGCVLHLPAHTVRRAIIDLGTYACVYPTLTVRGGRGAVLRMHWAESLYEAKTQATDADDHLWSRAKGNRDVVEGKYFVGHGPAWKPRGGRSPCVLDTLWWQTGRYIEVSVSTAGESITMEAPRWIETRYPLELESHFRSDDASLAGVQSIVVRGLQMCAHETYMDCPYWEQLMYAGDTRIQALCTHVMTLDDRLPRRALRLFDESRLPSGLTQSRFPSANGQVIPPFSLLWISMLHDFMMWRGDASFVASLLPGVRAVLEAHLAMRRGDGLVAALDGWNFVDWVPGWRSGEPPGAADALSGTLMNHLVLTLRQAADLESYAGDAARAALWARESVALASAVRRMFWNEKRGLMADDVGHTCFPEHTQALACLAGHLSDSRRARIADALEKGELPMKATVYFTHYVLEALAREGRTTALHARLEPWKDMLAQGFRTPYEAPGATRSDCHAWSSHPLYHLFACVAGIRPACPGFGEVEVRPQMGPLRQVDADLVHPHGQIRVRCRVSGRRARCVVSLPRMVTGTLHWGGRVHRLSGGKQEFIT